MRSTDVEEFLRGESDVPVAKLGVIISALGVDRSKKYRREPGPPLEFFRNHWIDSSSQFEATLQKSYDGRFDAKISPEILGARLIKRGKHLGAFLLNIDKKLEESSYFIHPGDEFFYVLEGSVAVGFFGYEGEEILKAGDAILIDSSHPHAIGLLGDRPAKVLSVIATPATGYDSEQTRQQFANYQDSNRLDRDDWSSVVATRIRIALVRTGLSQKEIIARSGLSQGFVEAVMRDFRLNQSRRSRHGDTASLIRRAAMFVGTPTSSFFVEFDENSRNETYKVLRRDDLEQFWECSTSEISDFNRVSHSEEYNSSPPHLKNAPIMPIHNPVRPTFERLIPALFTVAESTSHDCPWTDHHSSDPGEELFFIIDGTFGFVFAPQSCKR